MFLRDDCWVFRADLVVEGRVVVELKTAESIGKAHEAQLLHYLRAPLMEIGLLMNFGPDARFRRIVMHNSRKTGMPGEDLQQIGRRGKIT
jgi:hypothetical protein